MADAEPTARLFNVIGPGMPHHLLLGRIAREIAAMPAGTGTLTLGRLAAPGHAERVRNVFPRVPAHRADCGRDQGLARQFGYRGPDMPAAVPDGDR